MRDALSEYAAELSAHLPSELPALAALTEIENELRRLQDERDEAIKERDEFDAELLVLHNRAEAAERALAEMREAVRLALDDWFANDDKQAIKDVYAALRPASEDSAKVHPKDKLGVVYDTPLGVRRKGTSEDSA